MNPQLNLFSVQSYQADLFGAEYKTYLPTTPLVSGPIEFRVKDSREYYDLSETILAVSVKIVNGDNNAVPVENGKDDVALVNNAMHSIFSDVQVFINGKPTEGVSDGFYPYRAYAYNLFSFSKETQVQQLFAHGFVRDDYKTMDLALNPAFTVRKSWNTNGAEKTFYGKLYCGMFLQDRLLVPGVEFELKLERSKDAFSIFNTNALLKPKVVITKASLQLLSIKMNPALLEEHAITLDRGIPAIYEINRVEIDTIPIKAKTTEEIKDELFHMRVPKYLLMFMVSNSAFHGDYTKNPFNFQHFNLKSLQVTRDDKNIPYDRFVPDFKTGDCLREFMSQYQSNNLLGKNAVLPITYDEFQSGYTVFQWNLSDNRRGTNAGPYQRANLKVNIAFAEPTPEAIVLVMYGIFESQIQVFGDDRVVVDGV